MKRLLATIMSVMALIAFVPMADAAAPCPPEVSKAKELPNQKSAQAPRSLAGARGQDVQVPRGQDVQDRTGGRGEDVQAPRGQATQDRTGGRGEDVQAPRGQDAQTPRGQDVQTPRSLAGAKPSGDISKASTLIKEAEAACKAGDMKTAKSKAEAAIATLK